MFISSVVFWLFVIMEHNMGVLSRFVLNLFVVAEARVGFKMFFFWAKNRGSLFLFLKKRELRVEPG